MTPISSLKRLEPARLRSGPSGDHTHAGLAAFGAPAKEMTP